MKVAYFAILLPGCGYLGGLFGPQCPTCPEPPPARVITVPEPCPLPGPLELPGVVRTECPGDAVGLVCYDIANAALILQRELLMKEWIRAARDACAEARPVEASDLPRRTTPWEGGRPP